MDGINLKYKIIIQYQKNAKIEFLYCLIQALIINPKYMNIVLHKQKD